MAGRRCHQMDAVLDELLELVFLRLTSPAHLVRAASTCKRWRRVIAGDGGGFLRRFGSLHGVSDHVVGHYCVEDRYGNPRPPSLNPVFIPSSSPSPWADTIAARNLALDFLPRGEHGDWRWDLADIRGGLLLVFQRSLAPRLVICDPLAQRHKVIPQSAWFHGCNLLGAFLLDGEDEDAGISLSNFRVTCMVFRLRDRNARACAFSSAAGGWASATPRSSTPVCPDGDLDPIHFAGSDDRSAYWTFGDNIILGLDKDAAKLSSFLALDDEEYAELREKRHDTAYPYQLPWPPRIQACLP